MVCMIFLYLFPLMIMRMVLGVIALAMLVYAYSSSCLLRIWQGSNMLASLD
jgi:hypothetical protein